MFLLRYYRFQITEVTFVMHYPFRNIYLWYARASEASERSESSCIFISQERTYVTSNVSFISQYTLFFEQYRYHLQVDVKAKISLCGHCLMNYFGISLLSLILIFFSTFLSLSSRYCGSHVSITTFNNCFYRCQITKSRICHTQSFHKHLLIICASERSERALRIITHFHFSGTHDYHK